jgi:monothiol glutaredoxin
LRERGLARFPRELVFLDDRDFQDEISIRVVGPSCRPAKKARKMSDIAAWIDSEVKSNDVILFMKGTPAFPQCGFSSQVVQILDYLGVEYKGVNVLENADIRQGIKEYSNWPTIPQLYVKGEFVGGCDIIREMFQEGELQTYLTGRQIAVAQQPA